MGRREDGGSQVQVNPGGTTPANGSKRYRYNAAGQLVKVESYDGSAYQPQAEMGYNGLGDRLTMTAWADGTSLTTHYVLDELQNHAPLSATTSAGLTTWYEYGAGLIAEEASGWSYSLVDGLGGVRQLAGPTATVTLGRSFTPWGDTLEIHGTGSFTTGYFGGIMDTATGLLYVGNGQYYDPYSGRFLNRNVKPNQVNPYVPWKGDPSSALISPLVLLVMIFGKKKKRSKWDNLVILLVLGMAVGMSLTACGGGETPPIGPPEPQTPTTTPPGETPAGPDTTPGSTPAPTGTANGTPSAACEVGQSSEPTPTTIPGGLLPNGSSAYYALNKKYDRPDGEKVILYGKTKEALSQAIKEEYLDSFLQSFTNPTLMTEVYHLTKAITRRYYEYCRTGAWTAICLNSFWGYFQFAHNGHQSRTPDTTTDGVADAILHPGTKFGSLTFDRQWSIEGCSGAPGGGVCHWANIMNVPAFSETVIRDSVKDKDTLEESYSQVREFGTRTLVTYLYKYGENEYFIVLNQGAYDHYCLSNPGWCYGSE